MGTGVGPGFGGAGAYDPSALRGTGLGMAYARGPLVSQFVPLKQLLPKSLGNDVSRWREFQTDVEEWLEAQAPGMRVLLRAISRVPIGTIVDDQFLGGLRQAVTSEGGSFEYIMPGRNVMFMAFRKILEGDAKDMAWYAIQGRI